MGRKQSVGAALALSVVLIAAGYDAKASQAGAAASDPGASYARSVAGKTYRSFSPQHGTQVGYLSTAGRAYLWYPGNVQILAGEWRAEPDPLAPKFLETPIGSGNIVEAKPRFRLCYRYGPNSYNPATGSQGDAWECQSLFQRLGEAVPGDVFGLAGRRTASPFVMERRSYSYSDLKALAHGRAPVR